MSLAIRIQELRKKSGDSQEQLAEKLGVSRQAVSKWESEQGIPDLNNLIKISDVYNVSLDFLVKGISPETVFKDTECMQPKPMPQKKKLDRSLKKVLLVLLIFFGVTLCGVIFLSLLTLATQFIVNI